MALTPNSMLARAMGSNTTNDASKYEHDQMHALAREPLVDQASSMLERAVRGTGGPALPSSLPFQGARGPHTQCSLFAFDRSNAHGQQSDFGRRGDIGPNTQPGLGVGPHGYGSSDFFNFRVPRSALDRRPEPTPNCIITCEEAQATTPTWHGARVR